MEPNPDYSDPVMSIGTLAEKVGLSVSAVRKYENECLIIAHRTPSGHRLFSREDVDRIRNIQRMIQDLGLNIWSTENSATTSSGIPEFQNICPFA